MTVKNFVGVNAALGNCTPGALVHAQATVAAATTADAGPYRVYMMLIKPDGSHIDGPSHDSENLTTTPTTYADTFVIPDSPGSAGVWQACISVRDLSYIWQNVTQTTSSFTVSGSSNTLVGVSGDDQGGSIGVAQTVVRPVPVPAPMTVRVQNVNNGAPIAGVTVNWATTAGSLSATSAVTDVDGKASSILTSPATPQLTTVTATVAQGVNQSVVFHQNSHMPLYGTYSAFPKLLRPVGLGDPLAGGGFLPDTGDVWVPIASASDEFNGSSIDLTKWRTRLPGGWDHYNDELQRYVDSGITVSGGSCKLTAHARAYDPANPGHAPSPSGFNYPIYDSGVITSHTLFAFGYFEAKMKFPTGTGIWPAWWLYPDVAGPGEIDIVEFVVNNGTDFPNMLHNTNHADFAKILWAEKNQNTQFGYWKAPAGFSPTYFTDDYHVFGCYWNELDDSTTTFIDGYPVCQQHIGPAGKLSPVIFNMAKGGGWPTTNASGVPWTQPVSLTDQVFEIDYIRVFQKAGKILTASV